MALSGSFWSKLGKPELSLQFAKSCLESCEKNGLCDIAYTANEAIERAYLVVKDYLRCEKIFE